MGYLAMTANVAAYGSPLAVLMEVLNTRSPKFLSFPLAASQTVCSSLWVVYGFLISQIPVMVPNVLGVLFSLAQILLFCVFRGCDVRTDDSSLTNDDGSAKPWPRDNSHLLTNNHDLESKC